MDFDTQVVTSAVTVIRHLLEQDLSTFGYFIEQSWLQQMKFVSSDDYVVPQGYNLCLPGWIGAFHVLRFAADVHCAHSDFNTTLSEVDLHVLCSVGSENARKHVLQFLGMHFERSWIFGVTKWHSFLSPDFMLHKARFNVDFRQAADFRRAFVFSPFIANPLLADVQSIWADHTHISIPFRFQWHALLSDDAISYCLLVDNHEICVENKMDLADGAELPQDNYAVAVSFWEAWPVNEVEQK